MITSLVQAQNLDQDSCAIRTLTKKEITAYQALLIFTESQIDCKTSEQNKEKCWKRFLSSESFYHTSGTITLPWTIEAQNSFIEKVNIKSVTDSIWIKSWTVSAITKDTTDYYYINFDGNLGKLYSDAAASNEIWAEIW